MAKARKTTKAPSGTTPSSRKAASSKVVPASKTKTKTAASDPKRKSSGPAHSSSAPPLSEEEARMFKELQAKINANQGAILQEQQDELVRKRNADMMAAEQSDNQDDNLARPISKKSKTRSNVILDSDEEDLNNTLGGFLGDDDDIADKDNTPEPMDDAAEDNMPLDDDDDDGNGMNIEDDEDRKPSKRRTSHSASRSTSVSNGAMRRDKLTKNNFSPSTARLANSGKSSARERVAFLEAFPKDKDEFVWDCIQHSAKDNQGFQDALQKVLDDVQHKEDLIEYVGYAMTGLRGELKLKAKSLISGHYGIPGKMSKSTIEDAVRWLLEGARFTRAGLDVEKQEVTDNEPFGYAIIADIIRMQWFGKGKADILAYNKMVTMGKIPSAIIILVVTAVENALMEWSSGARISLHFSDEGASARYAHHTASWNKLEKNSPSWTAKKQKDLFREIMRAVKRTPIQSTDENLDLDDIDFAHLERIAQANP